MEDENLREDGGDGEYLVCKDEYLSLSSKVVGVDQSSTESISHFTLGGKTKVYHSYDHHREEGLVMLQPSNYHHSDQL